MIKVRNLTKYYGERLAVDNISFDIGKGEIVGLLGPNAAGKTTTMRILTGFLMPTKGDAWIADCNMVNDSLEGRKHIGYMPESVPLYTDMTVRDYLSFFGRLRGLDVNRTDKRIDDVVSLCHLEEYIDTIIGKLSKGFRQRVGLAQSIIHEPEVLILDEPTVGRFQLLRRQRGKRRACRRERLWQKCQCTLHPTSHPLPARHHCWGGNPFSGKGPAESHGRRDAPHPRQSHRHGLPGTNHIIESGAHG